MVVLMEEFGGLSLKRKGADETELFDVGGKDRSVFPLSCRATKMRRLACHNAGQHCHQDADGPAVSGGGGGGTQGQADLPMGDASPSPAAATAAAEEEKSMVLYGGGASNAAQCLRPRAAHVRAGADWVVRAMLREADSRTVRELLAGAQEQGGDLALAVVPWVPPSPAEEPEPSVAEDVADDKGDSDGAAAMDVEEKDEQVYHWTTRQTAFGCGEGFVYRWPQHCMEPPQLQVVGQASPVMWSW